MFQFSTIGLLALIAVAMCWGLGLVLYRVGASGSVARRLASLLAVEGVVLLSAGNIDRFLTPEFTAYAYYPVWLKAQAKVHLLGDCTMLALYPPFIAAALNTRMTRPLASPSARHAIVAVAALLFLNYLYSPANIGKIPIFFLLSLLFGFALVASSHAWYTSEGAARVRARAFTAAFGIRDLCWGFVYGFTVLSMIRSEYQVIYRESIDIVWVVYILGTLFAVPLIAYGILRAQLFDIDLRIRWTIKQSTLAATIVAIVYLASETAERFLSDELGNIAGLLAAAIVVFFLAPLQRMAEGVAGKAMPNTQNTPEYVAFRKLQVYEAAIAEAQQDGGISDKERLLLNRLRDSLGVSREDAECVERDLGGLESRPS